MRSNRAIGEFRLNGLTAQDAGIRITRGEISSRLLVQDCLDRIEAREEEVKAWDFIDPEYVLAQAAALDACARRSPLHGVPIGIKDIFDTFDMPTAHGFRPYEGQPSLEDSFCVAALRAAGMVIMGKTVTTEFACPQPRRTRNPLDLSRSPGVSSSGSAAAVADFMIPLALGSQTGGSIIVPAAYCGVYGYKASPSAIDRAGYRHCKPSLDSIGIFARCVDDLILLRSILTRGRLPEAVEHKPPPRIGFVRSLNWDATERQMQYAMNHVQECLRHAGAAEAEIRLPDALVQADQDFAIVNGWESLHALSIEICEHADSFNEFNRRKLDFIKTISHSDYSRALDRVRAAQAELDGLIKPYDVLVMPSAPGEALKSLTDLVPDDFAKFWSLMQMPTANLPLFLGTHGLPLGLQVIGRNGDDAAMLSFARWIDLCIMNASDLR